VDGVARLGFLEILWTCFSSELIYLAAPERMRRGERMPFTPFHFGPGAAIKAVIPRQFSFSVFCFAQVVMDTEVLVNMARGGERWHGYFHTYLGAVGVGVISLLIGWPICQQALRWWHSEHNLPLKEYYNPSPEIRPIAAISGAFVGSFSHVLLDGIMHQDTRPLFPFSEPNEIFGLIEPGMLHLVCLIFGVIGAVVCARFRKGEL
jgi:Domain of unknown function (DUF4184)